MPVLFKDPFKNCNVSVLAGFYRLELLETGSSETVTVVLIRKGGINHFIFYAIRGMVA